MYLRYVTQKCSNPPFLLPLLLIHHRCRKLPPWGPGDLTELTQDQRTSVDVSADCESLQAQKRLPAEVCNSSMPRRGEKTVQEVRGTGSKQVEAK